MPQDRSLEKNQIVGSSVKSVERLQKLIAVGEELGGVLDFVNQDSEQIVDLICDVLNCQDFLLYCYDKSKEKLVHAAGGSFTEEMESELPLSVHSFPGECALQKTTIHLTDPGMDIRYARARNLGLMNCDEMLLAPLINKGEVLGVIQLINSQEDEGFQQEDFYFLEKISHQLTTALKVTQQLESVNRQFVQVTEALGDSITKKDKYTGGHTKRVGYFADMISKELGLSLKERGDVRLAAVLHDIGKIGIADSILKKNAPLTDEEFKIMQQHPQLGYEILGHIDDFDAVIDGMRFHHERPDGTGYPYGLKGDEIPLIAQIVSVADTFDAMISTRPYSKGVPPMQAYHEVRRYAGIQFSEKAVEAFVAGFKKTRMYKVHLDEYALENAELKKVG